MKSDVIRLSLLISLIQIISCSVDYSILEDRYCNNSNECISGYRCDLATLKCVREDSTDIKSDTYSRDIKVVDIEHMDVRDAYHYDVEDISDEFGTEFNDVIGFDDIESNADVITDVQPDASKCETGTYSCRGKDLYKCDENSDWVFEKTCELDCINDHCTECLIGEKICQDETNIKECKENGLFSTEKCEYKCYNNQCVICTPQDKFCEDKTAVVCNPIGTKWERTDCSIGCSGGECMICEPSNSYKCIGNDLHICAANGLEYTFFMNCCHDNNCSEDKCVITSPRVIDYNPKDWKVGNTITFTIDGCFFVKDASRVFIDYGGDWKEITSYSNIKYTLRLETRIQVEVKVLTGDEYNFKVVNPDGQESAKYPIKKHY